jgi:hypothetical protein
MWRAHSRSLSPGDVAVGAFAAGSLALVLLGAATGARPDGPVACPLLLVTGAPCPFCGVTRSLIALGQLDLRASLDYSPLGVLLPTVAAVILVRLGMVWKRGAPMRWPRAALAGGATVAVATWSVQISGGVPWT